MRKAQHLLHCIAKANPDMFYHWKKSRSVHVRRGDYVTLGWNLDMEMYRQGMETFVSQVPGSWHLFVFSDDIPWYRIHEQELAPFPIWQHC